MPATKSVDHDARHTVGTSHAGVETLHRDQAHVHNCTSGPPAAAVRGQLAAAMCGAAAYDSQSGEQLNYSSRQAIVID